MERIGFGNDCLRIRCSSFRGFETLELIGICSLLLDVVAIVSVYTNNSSQYNLYKSMCIICPYEIFQNKFSEPRRESDLQLKAR